MGSQMHLMIAVFLKYSEASHVNLTQSAVVGGDVLAMRPKHKSW